MKYHLNLADPHPQYAPKASPVFTGELHSGGGATFGGNIHVSWGGRSAIFHENGDVTGPMWGGPLSSWLHNQLRQGVPPGIPLPLPQQHAPAGWLKCNGTPFDKALHPLLAQAYPSGVLLDLRGEFIRGWDDGRGVNPGRALLSPEGGALQSHKHGYRDRYYVEHGRQFNLAEHKEKTPDKYNNHLGSAGTDRDNDYFLYINSITSPSGGSETRPRNGAFNYIVRAA